MALRPDVKDPLVLRKLCFEETASKIQGAMKRSDVPDKAFCCFSDIKVIWMERNLRKLLVGNGLSDEQIDFIRERLLCFLSFIVWAEIPDLDWFSTFKSRVFNPADTTCEIFTDDDLPLDLDKLKGLGFKSHRVEKSWEDQYRFIPASLDFSNKPSTQLIEPHVRFPFELEAAAEERGGYGVIKFNRVPPEYVQKEMHSHATWQPNEPYAVAVKSFRGSRADAQKEVETLCRVKATLPGDLYRITLHHTIIEQGPQFYIILPLADLGNLDQFLRSQSAVSSTTYSLDRKSFDERFPSLPSRGTDLAGALLEQCVATADALRWLHAGFREEHPYSFVYLAHMDLKPDNILLFERGSVGYWKLTDFGISVIKKVRRDGVEAAHTMYTGARRPQSTYQAPEVEKSWHSGGRWKVGRKTDVWSFATILAEILTFAEGGSTYVQDFEQARSGLYDNFYSQTTNSLSPSGPEFELRPQVRDWLRGLRAKAPVDHGYVACWSNCIERLLIVDPDVRPDAAQLLHLIGHVSDHNNQLLQGEQPRCLFNEVSVDPPSRLRGSDPTAPIFTTPNFPPERFMASSSAMTGNGSTASGEFSSAGGSNSDAPSPMGSRNYSDPVGPSTRHTTTSQYDVAHEDQPVDHLPSTITSSGDFEMPNRRRVEASRASWNNLFGKRFSANDVALSRHWIAYLSKSTIFVCKIHSDKHGKDMLTIADNISLPQRSKAKWTGIAIADAYTAVWGTSENNLESLLEIYEVHTAGPAKRLTAVPQSHLKDFDFEKRVALSAEGVLVVISLRQLLISRIDSAANPKTRHAASDIPEDECYYEDISFNEKGDTLYAWAAGRRGWLLTYRLSNLISIELESKTPYDYGSDLYHDLHLTRLLPYTQTQGCIIIPEAGNYIDFSRGIAHPSHNSTALSASTLWPDVYSTRASCIYEDLSFIVVEQQRFGKPNLMEYHLRSHGVQGKANDQDQELCQLGSRLKKGSLVTAFRSTTEDTMFVIICQPTGSVEAIKFITKV